MFSEKGKEERKKKAIYITHISEHFYIAQENLNSLFYYVLIQPILIEH